MKTFGLETISEGLVNVMAMRRAAGVTPEEFVACDFDGGKVSTMSEIYKLGQNGLTIELAFPEKQGKVSDIKSRAIFVLEDEKGNVADLCLSLNIRSGFWVAEHDYQEGSDQRAGSRLVDAAIDGVDLSLLPVPTTHRDLWNKLGPIAKNVRNMK